MRTILPWIIALAAVLCLYGCDSPDMHTNSLPSAESGAQHGAPTKSATAADQ
jgi:hypothetical protein